MTAAELNSMMGTLPTINASAEKGKLYISDNPGSSDSTLNISIAESKNWIVTN
jgi:hypothetical protein